MAKWHYMILRTVVAVVTLIVLSSESLAQISQAPLTPPGDTGRRITDEGLLANYYPAPRQAPAVLLLGGSVGGLTPEMNNNAKALQAEGFTTLHLSYYRAPGQNPRLELIPLEYFATALRWLKRQPEADADNLGILGGSKGAEAALLIAIRHPEVKAVLATLPSSVVWPGIVWETSGTPIANSWSEHGRPLPHLPHAQYDPRTGLSMADHFATSLNAWSQHPDAVIPVERIQGAVFLVCGEQDRISPSCPMARQIDQRLRDHRRPAALLLAYKDAGHTAFGQPIPIDDPHLATAGGSPDGARAARADSWNKAVAFLNSRLRR